MRWDDFRPQRQRRRRSRRSASGGGMPGGAGGLGIGTIIILGLIGWALGIDPSVLINGAQILSGGGSQTQQYRPAPPAQAGTPQRSRPASFVAAVLGDTEDRWTEIFARRRQAPIIRRSCGCIPAREPGGCGMAQSAMGPFYCPRDQRIYLDTSFFHDMQTQVRRLLGRQGLQVLRGLCDRARGRPSRAGRARHPAAGDAGAAGGVSKAQANALQVRVELQADCLAGVWANRAKRSTNFLEPGDVDQALQTASAIGDDRLQKQRRATSCRTASPTAPRISASAGSTTASTAARSRPATRLAAPATLSSA